MKRLHSEAENNSNQDRTDEAAGPRSFNKKSSFPSN